MLDYQEAAAAAAQERAAQRDSVAQGLGYPTFTAYLLQRHRQDRASSNEMLLETGLSVSSLREGVAQSIADVPYSEPMPARPARQPRPPSRRSTRPSVPLRIEPVDDSSARRFLRAGQVATMLGLSKGTVLRAVANGHIQAWRTPGGHLRIDRAAVEAFVARARGDVSATG
jgi:excisionase family DNA binding protein